MDKELSYKSDLGTYPVYMDETTFAGNAHVEIAGGDLVVTVETPGITLGKRRLRHQLRIGKLGLWYMHKPNLRTDMYLRSLIHHNASVRLIAYLFIRFNLIAPKSNNKNKWSHIIGIRQNDRIKRLACV